MCDTAQEYASKPLESWFSPSFGSQSSVGYSSGSKPATSFWSGSQSRIASQSKGVRARLLNTYLKESLRKQIQELRVEILWTYVDENLQNGFLEGQVIFFDEPVDNHIDETFWVHQEIYLRSTIQPKTNEIVDNPDELEADFVIILEVLPHETGRFKQTRSVVLFTVNSSVLVCAQQVSHEAHVLHNDFLVLEDLWNIGVQLKPAEIA